MAEFLTTGTISSYKVRSVTMIKQKRSTCKKKIYIYISPYLENTLRMLHS